MSKFLLSCSSSCDLNIEVINQRGISYLPMTFYLAGIEYKDDFGQSIPISDFYKAMVDGAETKTTQANVSEYIDYFSELLKKDKNILHIDLSSGLSGSCQQAKVAAEQLNKEQKCNIIVVDSLGASGGLGLLTIKCADMRDQGKSIEEVAGWCELNKLKLHHWFFSTDLTFYVKGGRISKTSYKIGSFLKICPLMNVDINGKLIPRAKVMGKKNVIRQMVEKMHKHADNGTNYNDVCYITHSQSYDDANAVKALVEEDFPNLKGKVEIYDIGTLIGSHAGPGTVALFFMGEKRAN